LRSSHGWLKNVAFIAPVASATTASTSGFIPRRAHRAARDRAHLGHHGRGLVDRQLADRARLLAVARQVVEQVADGQQPEPLRALGRGRGLDRQRRLQPRGPRIARRPGGVQRGVGQRLRAGEGPDHDGRL
jgi:hypothetical protein